tara:strand:- start:139 stop:273 length:135 start_codon:yes stop_codon:yes gene_type:complete
LSDTEISNREIETETEMDREPDMIMDREMDRPTDIFMDGQMDKQ